MMTELCQELRNWFNRGQPVINGDFIIENGEIYGVNIAETNYLKNGQYYRIIGSVFNDGVHKYGDTDLTDEEFTGSLWAMAVPPAVIALASDIEAWNEKYGGVDGPTMSPFTSESFGGYSYTKAAGSGTGDSGVAGGTWESAFRSRLNMWRKI